MRDALPSARPARRRRLAAAAAGAALVLTSAASLAVPGTAGAVTRHPPAATALRWKLTLNDEFKGAPARPAGWTYSVGGNGWSHRQLQYFRPANVATDGHGHLVITARRNGAEYTCWYGPCTYTSGRMQTEGFFSQKYGKFEARIRIPEARGIWPAFWLKDANAEIDVIETDGRARYQVHSGAHAGSFNHTGTLRLSRPLSAGYHVYGVIWTPDTITWTVDGHAYSRIRRRGRWAFSKPFYLVLELAVGGSWPGPPTHRTRFPQRLTVSWIRVYRRV